MRTRKAKGQKRRQDWALEGFRKTDKQDGAERGHSVLRNALLEEARIAGRAMVR
jgi:hypothetical protein